MWIRKCDLELEELLKQEEYSKIFSWFTDWICFGFDLCRYVIEEKLPAFYPLLPMEWRRDIADAAELYTSIYPKYQEFVKTHVYSIVAKFDGFDEVDY